MYAIYTTQNDLHLEFISFSYSYIFICDKLYLEYIEKTYKNIIFMLNL